mgnify:CR=1 FL=1
MTIMKNIFKISFALAAVLGLASCDMNKRPYSVIDPENALESPADAAKLSNGLHTQVRSLAVGSVNYYPEIQADIFHATTNYGNRGGQIYRWAFDATDSDFSSIWLSCYSSIANANYFLEKAASVQERVSTDADFAANWADKDLSLLKGQISEAYFVRAYAYSILLDRFCPAYTEENENKEDLGLAIVTKYEPTSDKGKYPERSTLKASYEFILGDLEAAEENIELAHASAAGSKYITLDAVRALRARVALLCQDYAQAIQDATGIINSGIYALTGTAEGLSALWVNDNTLSECIMQSSVALTTEVPGTNNYGYIGFNYAKNIYNPDFIPEQWLVDLYSDDDLRKAVYFKKTELTQSAGVTEPLYIFNKFCGNPAMQTAPSDVNYQNAPKPFRLAELYLIAAEAYLKSGLSTGVSEGSKLLNELKSKRITGWEEKLYSPAELQSELKNERVRELVGEGFRLSDLKRYGNGFSRSASQDKTAISLPGQSSTENLSKSADDYRFVWPIPVAETDANPNIKQNTGYTN